MMDRISQDILAGARERGVRTSAPVLGIIPRPAGQWVPDLSASIVRVGLDTVRIPSSTRVAQNPWRAELFDRALLRRTALVAAGENPEVFGYQAFIRILYRFNRGA